MRLINADKLNPDCMTNKKTLAISQGQIANAPTVNVKEDIIKFISDNCRLCTKIDREMYENCEQCGFLKTFLENDNSPK